MIVSGIQENTKYRKDISLCKSSEKPRSLHKIELCEPDYISFFLLNTIMNTCSP